MDNSLDKPQPAHPERRQAELPWQAPKPGHEDPDAPRLIEAILQSPEYRQADEDVDFLRRDGTRGIRLQLDYEKAETLFEAQGIAHSIVVFGSTRIPEPKSAREKVARLQARLEAAPGDEDLEAGKRECEFPFEARACTPAAVCAIISLAIRP